MKKILTFLPVLICLQSMGQKPIIVRPTQKPQITQIPPGNVIKQGEMVKEAAKQQAEKQAAIDKVLNATVSKMTLTVWGDSYTLQDFTWFEFRSVMVDGNGNNKFHFNFQNTNEGNGKGKVIWTQSVSGKNASDYANYKSFLETGFTVKINFKDRGSRFVGKEFTANYSIGFTFTDGTEVTIPLQEFTVGSGKGYWKSTGDVNISKPFPGSVFPDPANPLVLAPVK